MKQSIVVVIVILCAIAAILMHHLQHRRFNNTGSNAEPASATTQTGVELHSPQPGDGLLIGKLFY